MLENFRTQKVIWDRANKKIFEKIEANSGDTNGRKLVVQVINQEVSANLSGTTLSLGWKSRNGAKGLDAFNVVDASKGIFEIYYTTEMLSNIGDIEASLILIESTGRIESSTFTISVRPSTVDDASVASENSFTALTEALVKVNDLEDNYAPRLNEVTAQLAQNMKKTEGFVNASEFDFVGDGLTPNDIVPLIEHAKKKGIQKIRFPQGNFLISGTVLVDSPVSLEGDSKETTTLSFNGVSGFETVGRVDFLQFKNIKVKGDQSLDTVGIKLNNYSSKHTFENVLVEGFGKWGIRQNGGLAFSYKNLFFVSNGKNTSDGEGGSFFLDKDGTNVGTTGFFENVYCQSGGKYGLRMDGGVSHTFINLLCEYHDKAIYVNNGNRVLFINFYEEANRTSGQKVHLHDTGATMFFLSVMSEPVYRTWAGVGAVDRQPVTIGTNDIELRYLTARQLKLSYYSPQSIAEDGRVQWNNKYLEIHNGTSWISHKQLLSGTTAQRPSTNLKVGMDYYDVDLGKPIYLHQISPIVWHDATGTTV